jgi:transposase
MFRAFQNGVDETFENASQTVEWFHVVQLFTDAVVDRRGIMGLAQSSCC